MNARDAANEQDWPVARGTRGAPEGTPVASGAGGPDTSAASLYAFRTSHVSRPLFSSSEPRKYVETGIVEAESIEAARDHIISRSSVLSLDDGLTLEVVPVSFTTAQTYYAQYDGPAMDDAHRPTSAKLKVGPLI